MSFFRGEAQAARKEIPRNNIYSGGVSTAQESPAPAVPIWGPARGPEFAAVSSPASTNHPLKLPPPGIYVRYGSPSRSVFGGSDLGVPPLSREHSY